MNHPNENIGFQIRRMARPKPISESFLRSLPDWFGIEKSIVQYRCDLDHMESFVADVEGRIVRFPAINQHNAHTAEFHVMGVRQEFHRRGIGRALVERAEKVLHHRGIEYVEVKTLAPSKRDANYDRTREFYAALGFRPVEQNNLWGDANSCLIMIKHLACQPPAG